MIEGIETGYEAKFNFPGWGGTPTIPYLLASVPRSGSTWLSHALWETGCLGAPLEYLNFEEAGPFSHAANSPSKQVELWRNVLKTRTSPNGVFGLKAFPIQLEAVQQANPGLVAAVMRLMLGKGSNASIIQLKRRDRTAHAISYARATLSGIWRSEQEVGERFEPDYAPEAIARAERLIETQEGAWDAMYRDLGIVPLVLWFEDALDDPKVMIERVADHLGIKIDAASRVKVPEIRRQSQKGSKAWSEAHKQR